MKPFFFSLNFFSLLMNMLVIVYLYLLFVAVKIFQRMGNGAT